MKYTHQNLEADIKRLIKETASLRKEKGHDYAGDYDTFSDFRVLGCDYLVKRIMQKCFRVLNLLKKPAAVKDEPLEKEFPDIVNFSLYLPILYKQQKNET